MGTAAIFRISDPGNGDGPNTSHEHYWLGHTFGLQLAWAKVPLGPIHGSFRLGPKDYLLVLNSICWETPRETIERCTRASPNHHAPLLAFVSIRNYKRQKVLGAKMCFNI